jgi:hypothetical protein
VCFIQYLNRLFFVLNGHVENESVREMCLDGFRLFLMLLHAFANAFPSHGFQSIVFLFQNEYTR